MDARSVCRNRTSVARTMRRTGMELLLVRSHDFITLSRSINAPSSSRLAVGRPNARARSRAGDMSGLLTLRAAGLCGKYRRLGLPTGKEWEEYWELPEDLCSTEISAATLLRRTSGMGRCCGVYRSIRR